MQICSAVMVLNVTRLSASGKHFPLGIFAPVMFAKVKLRMDKGHAISLACCIHVSELICLS